MTSLMEGDAGAATAVCKHKCFFQWYRFGISLHHDVGGFKSQVCCLIYAKPRFISLTVSFCFRHFSMWFLTHVALLEISKSLKKERSSLRRIAPTQVAASINR